MRSAAPADNNPVTEAVTAEEIAFLLASASRSPDDGWWRARAGQRALTAALGVAAFGVAGWDLFELVTRLTPH